MELETSEKSPSRLTRKDLKMSLCFAGCHGNTEVGWEKKSKFPAYSCRVGEGSSEFHL